MEEKGLENSGRNRILFRDADDLFKLFSVYRKCYYLQHKHT